MDSYYKDREVLVTGCSSGLGSATAKKLHAAGATVIGIDRNSPAEGVTDFFPTNLGDPDSIRGTLSRLTTPIWGVFNCAGLSGGAGDPVTVLRINFVGLRELNEGLIPLVPRGGAIVSTTSTAGQDYVQHAREVIGLVRTRDFEDAESWISEHKCYVCDRGGYPVSKESLIIYTLDRCIELAGLGIRINVVGPGVTETPMLRDSVKVHGYDHIYKSFKPLGRVADAEEHAEILIWLNSELASYVNGQVIFSDGGVVNRDIVADVLQHPNAT